MPLSSDPAVPTVTPVTISYSELQDRDKDLSVKIEEGFGPNGLGILSITQVPGYSSLRGNLLGLSPRLANLPEEVKKELEDPHSRYNFGWSHGKEKLESGKPVVEYAIHVSGLTATYKLRGHNNGLWYWPIGPRSVPDHYEGTIARETIVNVVNYNCGEIQQQPRFEAQLRSLLPQITSAFGANKSVLVTIDELKKQQQSSDATANWCDEN